MKKSFLFAALAAFSMVSCINEEFPTLTPTKGYGYINVNVSNDVQMQTRATVSELKDWIVTAVATDSETPNFTITSASTKVKAGTYSVSAKSHADKDAALAANDGWGAAYYEGTASNVVVAAGQTATATVNCGTAKNARLKVEFSLVENFTEYSLTANRNLVFNNDNYTKALAYYAATEEVNYTLTYKYNKGDSKTITGIITMNGAATENTISISSNDNGTISVTISYDETFGEGTKQEITFDAATGDKV